MCCRVSKWRNTPEELKDIYDRFEKKSNAPEIVDGARGRFAVYACVKRKTAERMGWIEKEGN